MILLRDVATAVLRLYLFLALAVVLLLLTAATTFFVVVTAPATLWSNARGRRHRTPRQARPHDAGPTERLFPRQG